jgi:hypothetical protein
VKYGYVLKEQYFLKGLNSALVVFAWSATGKYKVMMAEYW